MEENKKANTIPQKRLDGFIERLKAFVDNKILGKERKYSLEGLKRQSKQSKQEKRPKARKNKEIEH
ncbi:hypothetical protein [Bacillus thuringiensis]|uniref:hypothetical protein n=1 Tax=Bacillus thuringiensis TaxID=1428 RepID=UPI001F0C8D08|nr:hypothetical protein [Bacillus thuringiensis]